MPDGKQTTQYPMNTRARAISRPSRRAVGEAESGFRWHPRIEQLIARDFAFMPVSYKEGMLFRGIDNWHATLESEVIGLNHGNHSLAQLERDADVVFVSQDLSDAISVARPWEVDAGAVVGIPASYFARAFARGQAAVLAFADPGVVFRYPFFAEPVPLSEIRAMWVVDPASFA